MTPWINRCDILVTDPGLRAEAQQLADAPPPDLDNVTGLAPTEQETVIIEAARHAVAAETAAFGSTQPVTPWSQIHVLAPDDFASQVGPQTSANQLRHSYLQRGRPPAHFLHDTLHELAHGHGYLQMVIRQIEADGESSPQIRRLVKRYGLACISHNPGTGQVAQMYTGLNEATTDILAHRAAQRLQREPYPGLNPDIVDETAVMYLYWPGVFLAGRMFRYLADDFGGQTKARDQLFRDYLTGSNKFLLAMMGHQSQAGRRLAAMSTDPREAIVTAAYLGFPDIVKKIVFQE
ncbi:MAG: hypothetical protein PHT12_06030 [Patescibacteria group bacterium]|nr:hypothetical protein [Patescibacteria group bacterium]